MEELPNNSTDVPLARALNRQNCINEHRLSIPLKYTHSPFALGAASLCSVNVGGGSTRNGRLAWLSSVT
jgi:hypothetical protein